MNEKINEALKERVDSAMKKFDEDIKEAIKRLTAQKYTSPEAVDAIIDEAIEKLENAKNNIKIQDLDVTDKKVGDKTIYTPNRKFADGNYAYMAGEKEYELYSRKAEASGNKYKSNPKDKQAFREMNAYEAKKIVVFNNQLEIVDKILAQKLIAYGKRPEIDIDLNRVDAFINKMNKGRTQRRNIKDNSREALRDRLQSRLEDPEYLASLTDKDEERLRKRFEKLDKKITRINSRRTKMRTKLSDALLKGVTPKAKKTMQAKAIEKDPDFKRYQKFNEELAEMDARGK